MENASKVLVIGFYAWIFAMSIATIILMYRQVDGLYENVNNHVSIKSVLEEDVIGR
jgi:hypothetical protein